MSYARDFSTYALPAPPQVAVVFSVYSIFCVCNVNFSLQDLPVTSVNPTHLDPREAGLRLSSSAAWQGKGTGTAKTTDAVLTEVVALQVNAQGEPSCGYHSPA